MNLDQERTLPCSLDAERALLGSVLLHEESLHVIVERITAADFFRDAHRRIYTAMLALSEARRAIDLTTLRDQLLRTGDLDEVGGPAYIAALPDGMPRSSNIAHYASIVAEKSQLRRGILAANAVVARAYEAREDAGAVLAEGAETLFAIGTQASRGRPVAVADLVAGGMTTLEQAHRTPGIGTGLATGFQDLDEMLAGLQPADLVLLAARTSIGKTALALNIARNVAGQGKRVLVFSLEMSKDQLFLRLLAAEARVDSQRMRAGYLQERDWGRLSEAMGVLAELPLYIDDSASLSPLELRARSRLVRSERGGLDLVVVDYLQLMRGAGRFENRTQEIGTISRGLKALAKELEAPVIALCQLSRQAEGKDRLPQLSDLRESGDLEQDADVVLFIYRRDAKPGASDEEHGVAQIVIGKQRNGPTGVIKLVFIREYSRFESMAQEKETT